MHNLWWRRELAGNGGLRRWQCLRRRSCGMCHVWHAWSVWHVRCVCVCEWHHKYLWKMPKNAARACPRVRVCVCVASHDLCHTHSHIHKAIRYNSIWYTLRYMPPFGPQNMYLLSSKTHLKCHMRHMHKSTVHTWMPLSTHVNIISNTLYSIDEAVPKQLKVNKTTRIIVNFIMKCTKFRQIEMEYKKDL